LRELNDFDIVGPVRWCFGIFSKG